MLKFRKAFKKRYKEFLLSELFIEIMEHADKSVRKLAKEVKISPSIIQKIRSGKQNDIKINNFVNIVHACGYKIILEKNNERLEIKNEVDVNEKK